MLMKRILRFITGTVKYRVKCEDSSRIAALLMKRFSYKVLNTEIIDRNNFDFICISYSQKRIISWLNEYSAEYKIIKKFGILTLLDILILRPGIALGIIIAFVLCYLQSLTVWEIVIKGNNTISDEEIILGLENVGFKVGAMKNNDMLSEYCNMFIMNNPGVSRMSINMGGNIAFVEIGERTEAPNDDSNISMSGLFSKRNCTVELPIAENGLSLVKRNDVVSEGQMLISPIINGDNDTEYIVGAKGKVYGRTIDYFTVCIPLVTKRKSVESAGKAKTTVSFLGRKLKLPYFIPSEPNVFLKCTKSKLKIYKDLYFPIYFIDKEQFAYSVDVMEKSIENARSIAYDKMYSYISAEKNESETVFTEFEENVNEGFFILKCTLESIEDVVKNDF